jgi:hypothetical protein
MIILAVMLITATLRELITSSLDDDELDVGDI